MIIQGRIAEGRGGRMERKEGKVEGESLYPQNCVIENFKEKE